MDKELVDFAIKEFTFAEDFTPQSRLKEDLNLDSLDLVELCMLLEDETDTEITDADFESCYTVQDLYNLELGPSMP